LQQVLSFMKALLKIGLVTVLTLNYLNAIAQQKQPARQDLLNAMVNQKVSIVEMKEVTMAEGQKAPKHLHPCPVVGYVLSGNVLFQIEGEESRILKQGEAFYEPKNKVILHFDNALKDKPLTFVAFYLKEQNEENIKLIYN
jgi:quercetin dioxygenase-like cupin family protein